MAQHGMALDEHEEKLIREVQLRQGLQTPEQAMEWLIRHRIRNKLYDLAGRWTPQPKPSRGNKS